MKLLLSLLISLYVMACSNNANREKDTNHDTATSRVQITNSDNETDSSNIAFGFSNESGNQVLLVGDSLTSPARFSTTINKHGQLSDISYNKQKAAGKEDTGREIYYNFNNSGGYLYDVKSGTVNNGNSVVLFSKDFLSVRKYINLAAIETKDNPAPAIQRVEKDRNRKIKKYEKAAQLDQNRSLYLFEFELKNDSALVVLAYITPDKIVYKDFAAKFDETTTWRADDNGDFGFYYYKILAAFEKNGTLELITDWLGAEGYLIEYMKEDVKQFKEIKKGYRYTVPE